MTNVGGASYSGSLYTVGLHSVGLQSSQALEGGHLQSGLLI